MTSKPLLITTRAAAALVSRSPKRFIAWARKVGIPCVGQGTSYLWDPRDIEAAIEREKRLLPGPDGRRRRAPASRKRSHHEDPDELFKEADELMEKRRLQMSQDDECR